MRELDELDDVDAVSEQPQDRRAQLVGDGVAEPLQDEVVARVQRERGRRRRRPSPSGAAVAGKRRAAAAARDPLQLALELLVAARRRDDVARAARDAAASASSVAVSHACSATAKSSGAPPSRAAAAGVVAAAMEPLAELHRVAERARGRAVAADEVAEPVDADARAAESPHTSASTWWSANVRCAAPQP